MKKILYFDAFNGAAGDMILGGLIDLGMPLCHLQSELDKLALKGFRLSAEKIERQGMFGTNFQVILETHHHRHHHPVDESDSAKNADNGEASSHSHAHPDEHHHRGFSEIRNMIETSRLDEWVKEKSIQIFRRLAEAEAKVHGSTVEEVHFHEVGAIDSIVDIVGACIGFKYFNIQSYYSSALNLGGGTVTFSHGTWPVPTPATAELVQGFPSRIDQTAFELTTPTGAAIITTLVEPISKMPQFLIENSGFGAGDKAIPGIPNMLRLLLGEVQDRSSETSGNGSEDWVEQNVVLLEATIDDMDGEALGFFLESAFKAGALDVYFNTVQMKKSRPGVVLTVICKPEDKNRIAALIFRETTTLGVRQTELSRLVLDRTIETIETEFGKVRFKMGRFMGENATICPEFEDVRRISEETGLPFKTVKQKLMNCLEKNCHD
jgi:uncharacterized protein (TIGR00299 family) protein